MKPKILFLTNIPAPFQLDLIEEWNSLGRHEVRVQFTRPRHHEREGHWHNDPRLANGQLCVVAPSGMDLKAAREWNLAEVERFRPNLVLFGGWDNPAFAQLRQWCVDGKIPFGFWLEPPNLLRNKFLLMLYMKLVVRNKLRGSSFVACIGDRSIRCYAQAGAQRVALVPYGQRLPACAELAPTGPLTLLFSGQFIPRHNLIALRSALIRTWRQQPGSFRLVLSGQGPEKKVFANEIEKQCAGLEILDRSTFEHWSERLDPMLMSDVLLYPSLHSGWGLVVPEALAVGCFILTTVGVEASRYYIKDRYNGLMIGTDVGSIERGLEYCIKNIDKIRSERLLRSYSARPGSSDIVARMLCELVDENK